MLGDITIYKQSSTTGRGSQSYLVAINSPTINAGEPVAIIAGASSVIPAANNFTTIASPFVPLSVTGTGFVGIAQTTFTSSTTAAGSVEVLPANVDTVYLINAKVSASISTQAKYDNLVGARVLLDLTASTYTCLLTDSALNGFIVRPLDVTKFPGKVAIAPREGIFASM